MKKTQASCGLARCLGFGGVKGYYEAGLWSKERVRAAIGKWITEEEEEEIIGTELCAMETAANALRD